MILYHQWMVFNLSLVIDLIGQLNCHVLAVRLVKVDWCISIRLLFQSVYCQSNLLMCVAVNSL